ncbi:hypothetical protein PG993_000863 [Apiospora rasikravindrae]|uniref:Uncharacterized protein n=1 Tax=Apiospora rasikravindrae TaxID=990691 RepID=A0ABR1U9S3_9PEZI
MPASDDHVLAALFAGFSIGFGWFTAWEAIQQTRRIRNPLRSTYIYMVWGEIVSNIPIGVLGWLLLDGILPPTLPVLFMVLFFWVFETQLQPQIIINRIGIIAESRKTVTWVKWSTVAFVGLINISVFVIWIPSHVQPPPSDENLLGWFVEINKVYDRITKVLILILDAGLNGWFVHVVKQRLVKQHRLVKYKPLISFTNKMMFISILMDVCLVVLLSLPNEMVYIQFHPCAYLVKLHIEMTMASLITRLARGQPDNDFEDEYGLSSQSQRQRNTYANYLNGPQWSGAKDIEMVATAVGNPSSNSHNSHSKDNSTTSQTRTDAGLPPKRPARTSETILPPRYDESKSSRGLPHPQHTMSHSRRPSLGNSIPGLGRTRFGYGDDEEISLTSNAGQVGGGDREEQQQETHQHAQAMPSDTPLPLAVAGRRNPTPVGSRRPSVTR